MGFSENLKQLRKEKGLSQEELAEIMDVSRQAISKWESGEGFPEVEKLLFMASKFNISLDSLMATEIAKANYTGNNNITGTILISSPHEKVLVSCYKVASTKQMSKKKNTPHYALFGVGIETHSFWGQPTTFLGWYADRERISKEIREIHRAIVRGLPSYRLKYSVKTERKGLYIKIAEE